MTTHSRDYNEFRSTFRVEDLAARFAGDFEGTWRAGAVYQTLFTAFGPKAIEYRLERSGAKLVVTDLANRPKLEGIAGLPQVMTVAGEEATHPQGDLHF